MNLKFLPDSEMGNLIREKDWSTTSLGPMNTWPENLHTSLSIMMNSRFPMFLFWGPELTSFYNDAYRPSFGNNGMHPWILGKPAEEAWSDIWHIVKKFPEQVLKSGIATWEENQLIPIFRNGKTEDVYWTFSHSPIYNKQGIIEGIFVLCMETTQEVLSAKKIKESEERFRTMAENSTTLIAVGDEKSNAAYFNKAWIELTGRPMEELLTVGWVDLVHPKDKERFLGEYLSAFDKRKTLASELRMRNKQGTYSWLVINATPRYYPDGSFAGYISSGVDVTEQKRLQLKERKYSNKLTHLFAHAPFAMCILRGKEYIVEMANIKNLELWGRQAQEVMDKPIFEAIPEGKGQGFEELLSKVFVLGEIVEMKEMATSLLRNGNTETIYVNFTYEPLREGDGTVSGILSTAIDVTDQVIARKKIEENSQQLSNLANAMPQVVWIAQPDGEVIYYNDRVQEFEGARKLTNGNWSWKGMLHPDDLQATTEAWNKATSEGNVYEKEHRLKMKDGGYRWHLSRALPQKDKEGRTITWYGTATDIHIQKVASEEIKRFEYMVENAQDAFILMREDGSFAYLNKLALERWGYTAEEANHIRVPDVDLIYNDEVFSAAFAKAQRVKMPEFETLHKRKDGTIYPVEVNMGGLLLDGKPHMFAVARDITERKKNENKIKESEELFNTFGNNIQNLAWIADGDGNIFWYNQRWLDYTGLTLDDMKGWGWQKVHHPDHVERIVEISKKLWITNQPFELTFPLRRFDGEYRWFLTRGVPISDEAGKIYRWIGTNTDIDEQKKSETEINYRRALLEAHNEASVDGLLLVDTQGKILSYNKRFIEIWNMPQHVVDAKDDQAALSHAMTQLVQPHLFIGKVQHLYRTRTESSTDILEFNDGKIVERYGYPVIGNDGTYYAWSWTFRDITEIQKADLAIRQSEHNFRQLAELMPEKITHTDEHGNVIYFNQNWLDYTGLSSEELKSGWEKVIHPDDVKITMPKWIHAIELGIPLETEERIKSKIGEYRWHLSRVVPVKDEKGKISKWISSTTEIQQQKELSAVLEKTVRDRTHELLVANDSLKSKYEELANLNKELESFTYVASHDLQEPLRKIQTFSARLLNNETDNLSETGKDYFRRMSNAAMRMQRLIEDLLAFSRASTGERRFENTDLNELINDVVLEYKEAIDEKHAVIQVGKMCTANIVPFQFRQVMSNLIGNALKFSKHAEPPNIIINSENITHGESNNTNLISGKKYCHITVKDNGIGFDPQYSERVFQVFQRLVGKEQYEGTGIGLAIVKKIIDNHNGVIIASSEVGQGARFDIYIPN